jgi:phage gp29-like protein
MAAIRPTTEELARPDPLLANTGSYADVLIPTDTVLAQKGRDYRVYREVLRDDQCKSAFQQRRDAVLACDWDVEPASESAQDKAAAEFIREQLNGLEWDRITDKMLYAVWYGHAVGECMWELEGTRVVLKDIKVRDRQRFGYDRERGLWLLDHPNGATRMPERKFWVASTGADHDDEPYGLGLAHYAYWPVFFKRNDIKFWLLFLEKFASPTVKGRVSAATLKDTALREEVLRQLRAFSHDTAVLVPDGVEVDLLEASRTGATSYEDLKSAMDAALAKIILSQTMTTDNGSSRSQAEVHEGVRDMVVKSDADLLCGSFNRQVVAWLTEWNFPGAKPPRVWRKVEPPEDLVKRAERDAKIVALGYEPTEDYIRETYGDGWQKKAVVAGMPPMQVADQLAAEFAELQALAAMKGVRRSDQQEIAEAAARFANRYDGVIGDRVRSILDHAEDSGDYATMRRHLLEMMGQPAPEQTQRALFRSGIIARLMGMFRQQRSDAAPAFSESEADKDRRHKELLAALGNREAPTINFTAPPVTVHVDARKPGTTIQTITRDDNGDIAEIKTTED